MGRTGGPCGAVAGVLMGIGLLRGRDDHDGDRRAAYAAAARFVAAFEERFGSTSCTKITGCDLRTAAGRAKARLLRVGERRCTPVMEFSAAWLADLLEKRESRGHSQRG